MWGCPARSIYVRDGVSSKTHRKFDELTMFVSGVGDMEVMAGSDSSNLKFAMRLENIGLLTLQDVHQSLGGLAGDLP